jgi:hypothetical protein
VLRGAGVQLAGVPGHREDVEAEPLQQPGGERPAVTEHDRLAGSPVPP